MESVTVSTDELKRVVSEVMERNDENFTITTGWAPKPPAEHTASKLMKIVIHSRERTGLQSEFWLWRDNAEPTWHLVSTDHWAVVNAQRYSWELMEIPFVSSAQFLEFLPLEVLRSL